MGQRLVIGSFPYGNYPGPGRGGLTDLFTGQRNADAEWETGDPDALGVAGMVPVDIRISALASTGPAPISAGHLTYCFRSNGLEDLAVTGSSVTLAAGAQTAIWPLVATLPGVTEENYGLAGLCDLRVTASPDDSTVFAAEEFFTGEEKWTAAYETSGVLGGQIIGVATRPAYADADLAEAFLPPGGNSVQAGLPDDLAGVPWPLDGTISNLVVAYKGGLESPGPYWDMQYTVAVQINGEDALVVNITGSTRVSRDSSNVAVAAGDIVRYRVARAAPGSSDFFMPGIFWFVFQPAWAVEPSGGGAGGGGAGEVAGG